MTATENGVSIPSTFQPANMDELESLATNISFPVILKPIDDVGGRGIVKVANIQQLKNEYLKSYKKYQTAPLIQNFVDGDDYCLTVLYEDGKLVSSMAYKNIHRFPKEAGAGSFRETVDDKPFLAVANSLLEPIGWHGIAELDFRWNGNPGSIPFLIEVNPRFWAGLFQSVASGIDYPYALYHMTIYGKAPFLPSPAIGHKTKIPGLWLISAVQGIAQSEKNYEELAYTWKNIQGSIKNKQLKESFKIVQQMLGNKKIEFSKLISVLRSIIADGRMATNDIFFRDDPFVVLGVLFILASLLRHRKLPPEILH